MDELTENWVALPDRPHARRALTGWPQGTRCLVAHASGNPFLVGNLDQELLTVATVGTLRVAVIGSCPLTATRLSELVARVRTLAGFDTLARALPGCWHLVVSLDGIVRVQGSLTGLRRVFHTRIQNVPVAGAQADVLARLAGADIDEQALAVRVACGAPLPPPLGEASFWRGVRELAPDHYLRIDPPGTVGELRWWHPPGPQLPLTVGANAVRQALEAAIETRRPGAKRLSSDLSGGMDSTSLCFLAARAGMDLLTFRWAEADMANDDAGFAAHAASQLPQAQHLVIAQAEMPSIFADPAGTGDTEAPYPLTRTLARTRHNAALLVSHDAAQHVAGHGGDELFQHGSLAYLHDLLRRRPLTAITHLRGYRALRRWPWRPTLTALAQRRDLGSWWYQQAEHLSDGPLSRRAPDFGWGYPLRAPRWVTREALETSRTVLCTTGDHAQPLANDRGQHATLTILRMAGPAYRQLARVFAAAGVRLELPFFDDRVVEAVLAVPAHEASSPWRYKPLLVEAMRPVLPEMITARRTKGEFGEDVRIGLRRHRDEILQLFADSTLAAYGLIKPEVLRRQLLAPQVDNTTIFAVEDLLGCETWLRATQHTSTTSRRADAATAPC